MSDSLLNQALLSLSNRLSDRAEQLTEKPSEWIQKHFYVPDPRDPVTGEHKRPGPIILAEHQIRLIDEALSKNADGMFKYSTIIYSAIKKSGKSALSSAVALYMAYHNPSAYVPVVANDGKQSEDRLYGPIVACFRLHDQLGGIFKGTKYTQTGVVLPNYTKLEPINVDAAGEAGSQPVGIFFCFDEETEILTRAGWKKYNEYSAGDEFLTLKEDGFLEYQKPLALNIRYYEGQMNYLETRNHSICVSPQHKMYGKFFNKNGKGRESLSFESRYIEDIDTKYYGVRVESRGVQKQTYNVPDYVTLESTSRRPELQIPIKLYLELLGWYLSEGCVHKKEAILIAQSTTSKYYEEILGLVARLGYKPSQWRNNRSICIYDVRLAKHFKNFGLAHEKYIPQWVKELPKEYLDIMLLSYWKGDGYKTGAAVEYGHTLYSTNSDKLRDDLSEIYVKRGNFVTITTYQEKRWGRPVHTIRVKKSDRGDRIVATENKNWKTEEYSGYIHCPTVPNGLVVTRRQGKICWQHQSELWGYTTDKKEKLFSELTLPPTLYGRSIEWVESYAGFAGESNILWNLYETGFLNGEPHPDFLDLQGTDGPVVRTNETARMFTYWDTEGRMVWQQEPNYYQHQASRLHPSEFKRLHRNQWATSLDSFVQEEWWSACENPDLPLLEDNKIPVVVGIDMAVTRDCAALVAVTRDPFDPVAGIAVRAVAIFNPKQLGGIIDQEKVVRPVIEDWAKRWNVVCWVYDPREMSKLAQDLVRDGVGWFRPFGQTSPRAVADKALHDMVVAKQISWNHNTTLGDVGFKGGPDDTLYKHITLAGASTKADSYRIEKLTNSIKIDAAVALSQAASIAMELAIFNDELSEDRAILRYSRGELTEEQFSKIMQAMHPALQERLKNGSRS